MMNPILGVDANCAPSKSPKLCAETAVVRDLLIVSVVR